MKAEGVNLIIAKPIQYKNVCYKFTSTKYAKEPDVINGMGSMLHGGRWNPKGLKALYLSLTPQVAMDETFAYYQYYGITIADAMPKIIVAITVNTSKILDLTAHANLVELSLSVEDLTSCDWRKQVSENKVPLTHELGNSIFAAKLEGILVPSAAHPGGKNLVVFPENLIKTSKISLYEPGDLPI